ncbi:MAG: tRNA (adenosine(37)-N6)-dimethylallyltransferase MiaA [Clostridiales Family XIII bacterium]|jgi:tRNA dimethylallyltransferase|nr:tRNA (adenosine(37)-N6)-dimethylallyltransferase MiaA [Clostridiales Family XIII bacterium]
MSDSIVIMGPTAVGKTEIAVSVAESVGGEIISADSIQVYRGLDIGAARPSSDQLARIPHHMIGVIEPECPYSAYEYRSDAGRAIGDILSRGKVPVIAGGTGLYIHSLVYDMDFGGSKGDESVRAEYERIAAERGRAYVYGLLIEKDPEAAEKIHPNNLKRVIRALERAGKYKNFSMDMRRGKLLNPALFLLTRKRADLVRRIDIRVDGMMKAGLVGEVERLVKRGLSMDHISMFGIGYKETLGYLRGDYSMDEMVELIKIHTRRYAKRQMTWFRRYEEANAIDLLPTDATSAVAAEVASHYKGL